MALVAISGGGGVAAAAAVPGFCSHQRFMPASVSIVLRYAPWLEAAASQIGGSKTGRNRLDIVQV